MGELNSRGSLVELLEPRRLLSGVGIFTADSDIGAPGRAGSASFNNGTYAVTGGGSDIWNQSDQFHFAYESLTGDGQIVARVASLQDSDYWAKGGIMLRQSLSANSADAYVTMTPHDQVQFLDRTSAGASASDIGDATGVAFPVWEKLVRMGNSFTGYWSSDGVNWNQLGAPVTIDMGPTVYVGLVASAHNNAALTTATFDNVMVSASPTTGVYRLATRGQPNLSLDVRGVGNANFTPVELYTPNYNCNQQWLVENQGDGTFKIYAYSGQNSLQMLDDNNYNPSNGNPVTTYQDNDTIAQRWIFESVGGGYWRIVPASAGASSAQTLEILGGNNATVGSTTDIWTYWGGNNQVFSLQPPGAQQILPSPKKGVAGNPNEIANIHPSWTYNWGPTAPAGLPSNVEFVPMQWGYYGNTNNSTVNSIKAMVSQPGVKEILGYNEPDSSTQSNLTVAQALDGWQYLQATGLPLISPAATDASDAWMQQFMAGAAQRGYRVDAVAIHWYGGDDPAGFLNYVNYIHTLYNKPVWITEFAPADWTGKGGVTAADAYSFMQQVIPALNADSFVQRYAWFPASPTDPDLGQDALYNANGTLTPLGRLYSRM